MLLHGKTIAMTLQNSTYHGMKNSFFACFKCVFHCTSGKNITQHTGFLSITLAHKNRHYLRPNGFNFKKTQSQGFKEKQIVSKKYLLLS